MAPRTKVKYYDDAVSLGRRLREIREAGGLSQRELSFPGCTAAYISRIEKGERVPSLQLIREFAARLGVGEHFISHGTHEPVGPGATFVEARVAIRMGDFDVARQLADQLLNGARSDGDRARASALYGEVDLHTGAPELAVERLERARLSIRHSSRAIRSSRKPRAARMRAPTSTNRRLRCSRGTAIVPPGAVTRSMRFGF